MLVVLDSTGELSNPPQELLRARQLQVLETAAEHVRAGERLTVTGAIGSGAVAMTCLLVAQLIDADGAELHRLQSDTIDQQTLRRASVIIAAQPSPKVLCEIRYACSVATNEQRTLGAVVWSEQIALAFYPGLELRCVPGEDPKLFRHLDDF